MIPLFSFAPFLLFRRRRPRSVLGFPRFGRVFVCAALFGATLPAQAEIIGAVDTAFKLIGRNHQVVVEVFDDPKVKGVSCYVSRARTGGVKGTLGLAEDTADASVACRQVGEIEFTQPLKIQEEVFSQSASVLFKKIRIVRMADPKRNTLVYLVYSDKLIDGSPQNNVTAVAVPATSPLPIQAGR